jgi:hypothetical protein
MLGECFGSRRAAQAGERFGDDGLARQAGEPTTAFAGG